MCGYTLQTAKISRYLRSRLGVSIRILRSCLLGRLIDTITKKNRQKIKIEANVIPEGSSTLSRLDGFEKQLEEHEALVRQKENNIKKTIEAQVAKERKCLKDEYDALMTRKESEYNNCMVDMK